jgi:hypothetical protein
MAIIIRKEIFYILAKKIEIKPTEEEKMEEETEKI